jgi:tetratricopeptide (TPR) repeat protein
VSRIASWRRIALLALLLPAGPVPGQSQTGEVGLRILVAETVDQAATLRTRALAGEPFEELAAAYSTDATAPAGGFLGVLDVADLSPLYQALIDGLGPGEISPIAETPLGYLLIQRVSLEESRWIEQTSKGLRALADGRLNEAEAPLTAALREAESIGRDYHLYGSLNNLGDLYRLRGDLEEAEPFYRRALEIIEEALGPDHPDVALSLNNLALLYRDNGDYAAAGELLNRAQAILVAALGPNHPNVAVGMRNLARLRRLEGNTGRAESLYNVALSIFEQALGPDDVAVADTLEELAAVLDAEGRTDEAAPLLQRADQIRATLSN